MGRSTPTLLASPKIGMQMLAIGTFQCVSTRTTGKQYFSNVYIAPNVTLTYRAKTRTNGASATDFCLRNLFPTIQCLVESLTCTKITHSLPTRLRCFATNVFARGACPPNHRPTLRCARSFIAATSPVLKIVTWFSLATDGTYNKSLDASGGSVFRIRIRPAMLEGIRAAASTQPLGGSRARIGICYESL
jgi:hypothetical protein